MAVTWRRGRARRYQDNEPTPLKDKHSNQRRTNKGLSSSHDRSWHAAIWSPALVFFRSSFTFLFYSFTLTLGSCFLFYLHSMAHAKSPFRSKSRPTSFYSSRMLRSPTLQIQCLAVKNTQSFPEKVKREFTSIDELSFASLTAP